MENIVLIGAGLHVGYCIDIIEKENKYKIVGIIDSKRAIGSELDKYKIIGRQEEINILAKEYQFAGGLVTVGDNYSRKTIADFILTVLPSFTFVNAIHPSVILGKNVKIGKGVVMMAGCIINPNCKVGDFCFFATGAQLEHDSVIEEYASLSAGSITGGMVQIGKLSAITLGVTIIDRVIIGENSVIGAGALVVKDVPDNVLVYGNPAKIIRVRKVGEKYLK